MTLTRKEQIQYEFENSKLLLQVQSLTAKVEKLTAKVNELKKERKNK